MDQQTAKDLLEAAIPILTDYGLKVIGALVILVVGKIASTIVANAVRKAMRKAKADEALVGFFGNLAKYSVLIFTLIAALGKFGIETTSFIAVMGAAGLAVGLALQGSLSNFASVVLLLIFRPFKIDDFIDTAGHQGAVKEIGIFTTTLASPDNRKVILPNASVTGGSIVNFSGNDTRRVDMVACIGYGDDIGKAREVLLGICKAHPLVLDEPGTVVEVVEMADSSVNLVVRPWSKTSDYWSVYFDLMRTMKEEFDKEGISIPFPQRDVHMHQVAAN